jgi:hypothetical protein
MSRLAIFAIVLALSSAAHAQSLPPWTPGMGGQSSWMNGTGSYDTYEADRISRNNQMELEQMRAGQSRAEQMNRQRGEDAVGHSSDLGYRPTYVPYGGYQQPFYPGPYVGTGR